MRRAGERRRGSPQSLSAQIHEVNIEPQEKEAFKDTLLVTQNSSNVARWSPKPLHRTEQWGSVVTPHWTSPTYANGDRQTWNGSGDIRHKEYSVAGCFCARTVARSHQKRPLRAGSENIVESTASVLFRGTSVTVRRGLLRPTEDVTGRKNNAIWFLQLAVDRCGLFLRLGSCRAIFLSVEICP